MPSAASRGNHRAVWTLSILALALSVTGCLPFLRKPAEPMPVRVLADPQGAQCSLLLLPGFWDRPNDFARHGFDAAVAERGLDVRILAADAHIGYYRQRTILEQLQAITATERAAGRKVWIAGISLGGAGSLVYAHHSGDPIEGLVLLAPFLGDEELIAEIEGAGGALAWAGPDDPPRSKVPEPGSIDRDEFARKSWKWLASWHRRGAGTAEDEPEIWLGWGRDDDFAEAASLAADLLPKSHALDAEGGHDWKAWRALWRRMVDAGLLDGCRADGAAATGSPGGAA